MKPPLLPEESLRRVMRTARMDGFSLLGIAGLFALISAGFGDVGGAAAGVIIAAAGAIELHGASLLNARRENGMRWLVGSQVYLLAAVLSYALWRVLAYDPEWVRQLVDRLLQDPLFQQEMAGLEVSESELLQMVRWIYFGGYLLLAVLSCFYQGSMAWFYRRRRAAVREALGEMTKPE